MWAETCICHDSDVLCNDCTLKQWAHFRLVMLFSLITSQHCCEIFKCLKKENLQPLWCLITTIQIDVALKLSRWRTATTLCTKSCNYVWKLSVCNGRNFSYHGYKKLILVLQKYQCTWSIYQRVRQLFQLRSLCSFCRQHVLQIFVEILDEHMSTSWWVWM